MNTIDQLNWRYAVKEFDSTKKVSKEKLETLLESLRLSASSFGLQPWKFVIVEKQELKDKLLPLSWNQKQVVDASHVIIFCRPTSFGEKDVDQFIDSTVQQRGGNREDLEGYTNMMKGFLSKFSPEGLNDWMKNQIYIALGSFLAVCAIEEVDSCPMEGFSSPDYDKVLGLTEKGLSSVVVCPVGYRHDSDKYSKLAKVRYKTEDLMIHL